MNYDQLRSSGFVRLRPKVIRQFPNGEWQEVDEEWKILGVDKSKGVELQNTSSATRLLLYGDHILKYTSDITGSIDAKRGFLNLTIKVAINASNGVEIEPLTPMELAGKTTSPVVRESETEDSWARLSRRYSHHPPYWDLLLLCDYIEDALNVARGELKELNSNLIYRKIEYLQESEVFPKTSELFAELTSIATKLEPILNALSRTSKTEGPQPHVEEIRKGCERVRELTSALVEWETEVHFIGCPEKYERLFEILRGSTGTVFDALDSIPKALREAADKATKEPGNHVVNIRPTVAAPPNMKAYQKELKRLEGGFSWW